MERDRRRSMIAWTAVVAAWCCAARAHAGDACETATQRVESRSPFALECRELRQLDTTLRACNRPVGDPGEQRVGLAHKGVARALERCACAGVPSAKEIIKGLGIIRTPHNMVAAEAALEQATRCAGPGEQADVRKLRETIADTKQTMQYCSGSNAEWDRLSKTTARSCSTANLDLGAFARWLECSGTSDRGQSISTRLLARKTASCKLPAPSLAPPAPACEDTLAIANQLRRSAEPEKQQRLWNLVATELIAATSPRATDVDRACAKRMITTAIADGGVPDRLMFEWLMSDPDLRERYIRAVEKALKSLTSANAKRLVAMLAQPGIDVNQILSEAGKMSQDDQHRFFSVSGGLGRAIESVRLEAAFEQYGRGFDVVIGRGPKPGDCRYEDFVNMLGSAFAKAVPDDVAFDYPEADSKVKERIAARSRSCGKNADAATGPGCGAVIAIHLLGGRTPDRAMGKVQLYHVMPNAAQGSDLREIKAIAIPEFEVGCKASSQEIAAAEKLLYDLQSEFMKQPREAGALLDRPVDTCGLVPQRPVGRRATPYVGKGIRIDGSNLVDLGGVIGSAQNALKVWAPVIGEIQTSGAGASLRFWSVPSKPQQDLQLNADLEFHDVEHRGPPAASFTVVVKNDSDCRASPAERQAQAGHMIGVAVGSYIASLAKPPPPPPPLRSRRWLPAALIAGDAALVIGGLVLVNSAVNEQNRAVALGLDPGVSNDRLDLGRGLLIAGAAVAIGAIYVLVR